MSCNYAEGLSPYENKGVIGIPEKFENPESIEAKCTQLVDWIKSARHTVVHTGAGISTSAGIPDFRGPNGVWTLEKKGEKPNINISFDAAKPTATHMALRELVDKGYVRFIISQNIDGLHLKSGLSRRYLAELHGNMFTEMCNTCERQFVRTSAAPTVGRKCLGSECKRYLLTGRACRGKLQDTILDWEDNLPDNDLDMADYHSHVADLSICLGTTLQIVPSGTLPTHTRKYGGKLVIVNLQPTKQDKKADMLMNTYVDDVMVLLMKKLNLEIPEYTESIDPTKQTDVPVLDWTIRKQDVDEVKALYNLYCKNYKKRKLNESKAKKQDKGSEKIKNYPHNANSNQDEIATVD